MYRISDTVKSEINALARQVQEFRKGEIEPVKFTAIRVPMGIYEQRTNGTCTMRVRCAAGMITPSQLKSVALLAQKEGTELINIIRT